jgi:hypothetical protein
LNQSKYLKKRDRDESRFQKQGQDEINDWASIGVSPERAKAYALQCDADELEFLSPTIAEMKVAARALKAMLLEESNQIFNKKQSQLNKAAERRSVCVKCGQWFDRTNGQIENGLSYCGYCHAVCFSKKDTRWIPGKKE